MRGSTVVIICGWLNSVEHSLASVCFILCHRPCLCPLKVTLPLICRFRQIITSTVQTDGKKISPKERTGWRSAVSASRP